MKNLILSIGLLLLGMIAVSQGITNPVFNGPTQVGSNNTQNNYTERNFTDADKPELIKQINAVKEKFNLDSCIIVEITPGGNAKIENQIMEFLKSRGYKIDGSGFSQYSQPVTGIWVHRNKREAKCITITIGSI